MLPRNQFRQADLCLSLAPLQLFQRARSHFRHLHPLVIFNEEEENWRPAVYETELRLKFVRASASPATGPYTLHELEQQFIQAALNL